MSETDDDMISLSSLTGIDAPDFKAGSLPLGGLEQNTGSKDMEMTEALAYGIVTPSTSPCNVKRPYYFPEDMYLPHLDSIAKEDLSIAGGPTLQDEDNPEDQVKDPNPKSWPLQDFTLGDTVFGEYTPMPALGVEDAPLSLLGGVMEPPDWNVPSPFAEQVHFQGPNFSDNESVNHDGAFAEDSLFQRGCEMESILGDLDPFDELSSASIDIQEKEAAVQGDGTAEEQPRSTQMLKSARFKATVGKPERVRKVHDPPMGQRTYFTLGSQDVGLGRGGKMNRHEGNIRFHAAKELLQNAYKAASKEERTNVAQDLVRQVQEWGGRFLKKDTIGWYKIHNLTARTKCSQALREDYSKEQRAEKRARHRKSKNNSNKTKTKES